MQTKSRRDTQSERHDASRASWRWPCLIAHRGGGIHAPENTLAACRVGRAYGFNMMEYDVKLTRDGVPVLLHDDTLCRTSNGTGALADKDIAELIQYDFGAWHSDLYAGEGIPSLYSIAAYTIANNINSNIEIKPCNGTDTQAGATIAIMAQKLWHKAGFLPLLSSFSETALSAAQDAAPAVPRALLIEGAVPSDWESRIKRLGCIGLNLDHNHITRPLVHDIITAGYTLVAWTVNDVTRAHQLLDWGCHAIVTDKLESINPSSFR